MELFEKQIRSPLTGGGIKKIAEFYSTDIIKSYKIEYNIDVNLSFNGIEKVLLYRCENSGYEFYYPLEVAGKDDLYRQLATFKWYYIPWKWEYEQSLIYAARANSILEIGCGSGLFLENLKKRFPEKRISGLEITVNEMPEKFIINETIQEHVSHCNMQYDLVCSYQVLEHISEVNSFLEASIKALKSGGHLIISVPNNDGIFFKKRGEPLLNMPPHHMGLWNKKSLEYLTKLYPIQLVEKYYEPIQDYHYEWFKSIIKQKINQIQFPLLSRVINNQKVLSVIGQILRKFYNGHTFMFIYKKK